MWWNLLQRVGRGTVLNTVHGGVMKSKLQEIPPKGAPRTVCLTEQLIYFCRLAGARDPVADLFLAGARLAARLGLPYSELLRAFWRARTRAGVLEAE